MEMISPSLQASLLGPNLKDILKADAPQGVPPKIAVQRSLTKSRGRTLSTYGTKVEARPLKLPITLERSLPLAPMKSDGIPSIGSNANALLDEMGGNLYRYFLLRMEDERDLSGLMKTS